MSGADGAGDNAGAVQDAVMQVRAQAAQEIDRVSEQLRSAQAELSNRTLEINRKASTDTEVARINADSAERVAQIQAASDTKIAAINDRLDALQALIRGGDRGGERPAAGGAAKDKPKGDEA